MLLTLASVTLVSGGLASANDAHAEPRLVSVDPSTNLAIGGFAPSIDETGERVSFISRASPALIGLEPSMCPKGPGSVLVCRQAWIAEEDRLGLVSLTAGGKPFATEVDQAVLSRSGKVIALVANHATSRDDSQSGLSTVFRRDLVTNDTRIIGERDVMQSGAMVRCQQWCGKLDLSADGRTVSFSTMSPADPDARSTAWPMRTVVQTAQDIVVLGQLGVPAGPLNTVGGTPSLTADGTATVLMAANAADLLDESVVACQVQGWGSDFEACPQVVLWRPANRTLEILSRGPLGVGNGPSWQAAISGDGSTVAFASSATNLGVPFNGVDQLVIVDVATRRMIAGSTTDDGRPANGPVHSISISHDGRRASFVTTATNLGEVDGMGPKVFIFDVDARQHALVLGPDQVDDVPYVVSSAILSGDGNTLAVATSAKLSSIDQNNQQDVYAFDTTALPWATTPGAGLHLPFDDALLLLAGVAGAWLLSVRFTGARGTRRRRKPRAAL